MSKYILSNYDIGAYISDDDELTENFKDVKVFDSEKDAIFYAYKHDLGIGDDIIIEEINDETLKEGIDYKWAGNDSIGLTIETLAGEENGYDITKISNIDELLKIKDKLLELDAVDRKIYFDVNLDDHLTIDEIIALNKQK